MVTLYNRSLLLTLAFLEGGAVMCAELTGTRMIAPTFGSSLTVWTSVLATCISALAAGYFLGGYVAEKDKYLNNLLSFFLASAMYIIFMPFLARIITTHYNFGTFIPQVLLTGFIILFPPLLLLGATTPVIIKNISHQSSDAGKSSGMVYGVSTLGGILFTFLAGFFLIPEFGLSFTNLISGLLLAVIPAIIMLFRKKFVFPLVFILATGGVFFMNSASNKKKQGSEIKLLHQSEGLLGQLLITDVPKYYDKDKRNEYDRIMFVNRIGQTWVDKNSGNSMWSYINYITVASSVFTGKPDVLLLGLGGGTVARQLETVLNAKVEAVELDKRIVDLAKDYFLLKKETKIVVDDARHFLRTTHKQYDIIIFDVTKGEVPPSHALSIECFNQVKRNLKANAMIIVNFNGFIKEENGRAGRSIMKTLLSAGYYVNALPTYEEEKYRNILYLASLEKKDFSKVSIKLNLYGEEVNLVDNFMVVSEEEMEDAVVLSDDKPLLELLTIGPALSWREDYYNNFTRKFNEEGIVIFK